MRNLFFAGFLVLLTSVAFGQSGPGLLIKQKRWQHLDPSRDGVYGISMDRAYAELLKGRKSMRVIVAVLDGGVDTAQADLKSVLWVNAKEKGSDEDRNGYENDRYGWNFLGVRMGAGTIKPGFEYQRIYLSLKARCARYSPGDFGKPGDEKCRIWKSTKEKFQTDSSAVVSAQLNFWNLIVHEDSIWRKIFGKDLYTANDFRTSAKPTEKKPRNQFIPSFLAGDSALTNLTLLASIQDEKIKLMKRYSQDPASYRLEKIGDDYNDLNDRYYGNADVTGNDDHGTHVAGIIGAMRDNDIGTDGIADKVSIMSIKAVPVNADEYDKDIALGIRYAVDNGARVINLSFGKAHSLQREWVEDAIQYAADKDVLIVKAAGNEGSNADSVTVYPTSRQIHGGMAPNMITVGASGMVRDSLIASFSNYGRNTVDVFAPGVKIYSTFRSDGTSKYGFRSGTSMAAPVVAGIAAVLRSYFPSLSAKQVKYIIESSVTKIDGYVTNPGSGGRPVLMTDLCKTGGIVNAYEAVKLAERMARKK
jgi:subtilisin family serine protease